MFKIWAKVMDENRLILKDTIYIGEGKFSKNKLFDYLIDICHTLDIATPNVLTYHKNNFHKFNYAKFIQSDFMEQIDFDSLILESGN